MQWTLSKLKYWRKTYWASKNDVCNDVVLFLNVFCINVRRIKRLQMSYYSNFPYTCYYLNMYKPKTLWSYIWVKEIICRNGYNVLPYLFAKYLAMANVWQYLTPSMSITGSWPNGASNSVKKKKKQILIKGHYTNRNQSIWDKRQLSSPQQNCVNPIGQLWYTVTRVYVGQPF